MEFVELFSLYFSCRIYWIHETRGRHRLLQKHLWRRHVWKSSAEFKTCSEIFGEIKNNSSKTNVEMDETQSHWSPQLVTHNSHLNHYRVDWPVNIIVLMTSLGRWLLIGGKTHLSIYSYILKMHFYTLNVHFMIKEWNVFTKLFTTQLCDF